VSRRNPGNFADGGWSGCDGTVGSVVAGPPRSGVVVVVVVVVGAVVDVHSVTTTARVRTVAVRDRAGGAS